MFPTGVADYCCSMTGHVWCIGFVDTQIYQASNDRMLCNRYRAATAPTGPPQQNTPSRIQPRTPQHCHCVHLQQCSGCPERQYLSVGIRHQPAMREPPSWRLSRVSLCKTLKQAGCLPANAKEFTQSELQKLAQSKDLVSRKTLTDLPDKVRIVSQIPRIAGGL